MFNIVLLEPEIPSNTGNIGRTCLVTGSRLHLIEPMGFILNDRNLKRAGMDYWHELDVTVYDSWEDFLKQNRNSFRIPEGMPGCTAGQAIRTGGNGICEAASDDTSVQLPSLWMATTKARQTHSQAQFRDGDYIMFGKESAGIPEEILMSDPERCIRIPMAQSQRSLNLANSVAVVLYEALRQNDYLNLEKEGRLHRHNGILI